MINERKVNNDEKKSDLAKIVGREEVLLLRVEQVEAHLEPRIE